MRLSEAIRLGSMLGPQSHGRFTLVRRTFLGMFGPKVTEYCALGAAYQAATGGRCHDEVATEAHATFRGVVKAGETTSVMETPSNWPMSTWAICPECPETAMPIRRLIPHLNDMHKWSRERIADFVDPYEPTVVTQTFEDGVMSWTEQRSGVYVEQPTR